MNARDLGNGEEEFEQMAAVVNVMKSRLVVNQQELEDRVRARTRDLKIALEQSQRAEEELRQLNDALAQNVERRTRQLAEIGDEMDHFAYSVSHDLRAPLRAIDGYLGILVEDYSDKLDDEGQRLVGVVRENATDIARLIESILLFSRAGRFEQEHVEVDMNVLVEEVWRQLESRRGEREYHLCRRELPSAHCDPNAIRQVWTRLIDNAIKFSRDTETPQIRISATSADNMISYHVRDNGVGFDPSYSHKLFHLFQRLHGKEHFEGIGAGLAIVKRLIDKHRGVVEAQASDGAGATFSFSLPTAGQAESGNE